MAVDFLGLGQVVSNLRTKQTPVGSSAISIVGYDFSNNDLLIVFTDGSNYRYSDVPEEVFREFIFSSSKGNFFNSNIRNNYNFTRE